MTKDVLALPMECWAWIPGFEGLYQVSTRGRVRSVDRWVIGRDGRKHFRRGRILKPARDKDGYLRVELSRDGKIRRFAVHRLVAMAWIDNPMGKPQVNHIDEQKYNNDVFNLEWCTAKENTNWGTGIERQVARRLNGSLSKAVEAIDPSTGQVVKEFPSTAEAERNGFSSTHISLCCRGIKWRKTHKGYIWRYKE